MRCSAGASSKSIGKIMMIKTKHKSTTMKTNKYSSLVTKIATIGLLSAGSFTAYANGPDFGTSRVFARAYTIDDGGTDASIEFDTGNRWEFEINDGTGIQAFNVNRVSGHFNFGNKISTPDAPFHFYPPNDGTDARILCDNKDQGTATPRNMFHLRNNGAPRFVLEDTSLTGVNTYTFAMNPQGNFTMTRAGIPGAEIVVKSNGQIEMGPGTTTSFRVTNSGVQSTSFTTLSDREAKTDIEEVKSEEILDKLKQLPVSTWRFKSEEDDTRHIGPMAQDFHQTFGDGTNKNNTTINLGDMAGVALAGVKSLDEKIEERDQKIEALEARLARLEALLNDK